MSEFECIDCGQWSEALLPARFPHICSACLFPPRDSKDEDARGAVPVEVKREFQLDLMSIIDSWKVQGRGVNMRWDRRNEP